MKIKTSELTEAALDWAVAKCESLQLGEDLFGLKPIIAAPVFVKNYRPSSDWAQGGPIIERERIELKPTYAGWTAFIGHDVFANGHIPLIAAMRCFVASKLGDEVEVPEELQ